MQLISQFSSASVENCVLASVPDGERLREVCFSPDGTAVAFITSRDVEHSVRNANGTRAVYTDARNLVVGPGGGDDRVRRASRPYRARPHQWR